MAGMPIPIFSSNKCGSTVLPDDVAARRNPNLWHTFDALSHRPSDA